jgi:dihydrolipoamide dehydrogenase
MNKKYDIAILGCGPAGYQAGVRAAQLGLSAVIVEKYELGGTCLNKGCIPTKTLLRSAAALDLLRKADTLGIEIDGQAHANFAKIMARRVDVVQSLRSGMDFMLKKHGIPVVIGAGRIVSPTKMEVQTNGAVQIVEADNIIIAAGARPRSNDAFAIDGCKIISSEHALALDKPPQSMVVIGSGAVGCELAYFYAIMGTKITMLEMMPSIAPACDAEISMQIERSLRKINIVVQTNAKNIHTAAMENGCRTTFETKNGAKTIDSDVVLSAAGIQANIDSIGLEDVGIVVENGRIKVDSDYRTSAASVYAVGDVIDSPALAHSAAAEARLCVERIAGMTAPSINYDAMPSCIYINPEAACAGLTEQMVRQRGLDVKVGKAMFAASGKALASGQRDGFVKLIFEAHTLRLLGAHCIGGSASEILGELTMAVSLQLTPQQVSRIVHAHPTMHESIADAAEQCIA